MGPVTVAAAVLLLAGCATAPEIEAAEPVVSPEPAPVPAPVDEPDDPEPIPAEPPEPEPVEVEEPEPEPSPQVETQPARPDPARVREWIRDVFDAELARQPQDQELSTSEDAWFGFWDDGRDADAAWAEWFRDRYEAELQRKRDVETGQRTQGSVHGGGSRAGCMTGGAGYDSEDC